MRNRKAQSLSMVVALALLIQCAQAQVVLAPSPEVQTVAAATEVLQQFTTFQIQSIPQQLLREAQGIVIIPNVIKVGFIIAGRFGRGVALIRTPEGNWRVPGFVTFAGGSVGWQAGVQSTDVVLVFKNRKGIETLLSGSKFTLGADAAIAAGPVGRNAATGTDLQLNAEIYSYSRSRGLFAGVSLDGSILQVDNRANLAYYTGGNVPQQAIQLASLVASDSAVAAAPPVARASYAAAPAAGQLMTADRESVRKQLVDAAQRLSVAVDVDWRAYLALPENLQSAGGNVGQAELSAVAARYQLVQSDARYRGIAQLPQFQTTAALLRQYLATPAPSSPLPQR